MHFSESWRAALKHDVPAQFYARPALTWVLGPTDEIISALRNSKWTGRGFLQSFGRGDGLMYQRRKLAQVTFLLLFISSPPSIALVFILK